MACILLLSAGGLAVYTISDRSEIIPGRTLFVEFPTRIGQWRGHPSLLDPDTEKGLSLDDYILSDYDRPDGKAVNLYVAYYSSQRSGESPHSPIVCIPGGRWQWQKLQQINYVYQGQSQPLNRVVIQKGTIKQLVYYWFDERGRKIANEYWAKLYLLTDAILKNRTDGALVRLTTQIAPSETEDDADQRLQAFASLGGQGKYDQSIAALQDAVAADPKTLQPMVSLVRALVRAKQSDRAVSYLQSA